MSNKQGEIISIHIGQAGVQIGNACWELFCLEHGIQVDGRLLHDHSSVVYDNGNTDVMFAESSRVCNKLIPRTLFVDLEPSVIDEIRCGNYRQLFHPNYLVTGKEDAANNFARGRNTIGRTKFDDTTKVIRRLVEESKNVQGFIVYRSLSGGTGSGFASLLLAHISKTYPKSAKVEMVVMPSQRYSNSIVEPYNSLLGSTTCSDQIDVSFLVDNEALYNICNKSLNLDQPTFTNINRLTAQMASSITSPIRFPGPLESNLSTFQTNLVPYPRVHYPICSYGPLYSRNTQNHSVNAIEDITMQCFNPENFFVNCKPQNGLYMACSLLYRGPISAATINKAVISLKREPTINFVDWCPTGFKIVISKESPFHLPAGFIGETLNSVAMLSNSTALRPKWENLTEKFNHLFSRRAFVHWFTGEGLEESELTFAEQDTRSLIRDYTEVGFDNETLAKSEANKISITEQKVTTNTNNDLEDKLNVTNLSKPIFLLFLYFYFYFHRVNNLF